MRTLAISAINIYTSGTLVIVQDFLSGLISTPAFRRGELKVIVFCHSDALYKEFPRENLVLIPKPLSRKNWLFRLFYEYVWFWVWSSWQDIDLWVSLHDVTPNVHAKQRVVYCHNASPFYRGKSTWRYAPGFQMFRYFYEYVYRINLKKNDFIIVQQQWLRDAFVQHYGCLPEKVIVARPEAARNSEASPVTSDGPNAKKTTLVFPAFPRVFKNYEVLIDAMRLLTDVPLKIIFTFSGSENAYAREIALSAAGVKNIELVGFLSREKLFQIYSLADAMIFPSKLETWGLPLSEFKPFDKPIFAADLLYARETLSGYPHSSYFNPDDAQALSVILRRFALNREFVPMKSDVVYAEPFSCGWTGVFTLLGIQA